MKNQHFARQAIPKILFVLHSNDTGDNPYQIWFGLDSSSTRSNRSVFKIPYSRNSKSSVWNPYEFLTFSTRQAIPKITFVLHFTYTGDTPYGVWFNLNNLLIHWKDLFLKFPFREIQKVPYEILTFFTRQPIASTFLSYILPTQGILHAEFGWIWTTLRPSQ